MLNNVLYRIRIIFIHIWAIFGALIMFDDWFRSVDTCNINRQYYVWSVIGACLLLLFTYMDAVRKKNRIKG